MYSSETFFYRFRSTDALLRERNELENQEIYFASPEQLNDPMEGSLNLYWSGDSIVWEKFFIHYLLCLTKKLIIFSITDETDDAIRMDELVLSSKTNHPSESFETIFGSILNKFFDIPGAIEFSKILSTNRRKIYKTELKFYISVITGIALTCIIETFENHGISVLSHSKNKKIKSFSVPVNYFKKIASEIEQNKEIENQLAIQALFSCFDKLSKQSLFKHYLESKNHRQKFFIKEILQFPEEYINNINQLLFYPWYTACFVAEPGHAAMWGAYGDGHKGVCLKFRSHKNESGRQNITLKQKLPGSVSSSASNHHRDINLSFYKINYVENLIDIDFFRSIGRLSESELYKNWYSDKNGNKSSSGSHLNLDLKNWRELHWNRFESIITSKFKDWEHENEHR